MKKRNSVSAWLFFFDYTCALEYGVDAAQLAATLDFPLEYLEDPEFQVSWEVSMRLYDDAVTISGDEFLLLKPVDVSTVSKGNLLWYYAFNAPTLLECAKRGEKYFKILTHAYQLESLVSGEELVIRIKPANPEILFSDRFCDSILAQWASIWDAFAGSALELKCVRTTVTDPLRLSQYEEYFQIPIEGGSINNDLVYDKSAANLSNAFGTSDENLDEIFRNLLEETIAKQNATTSFEKKLMTLLQSEIQNGTPTLENIAIKMRMSNRTLQRRFADLGTTYSELLNQYRHQLAATYLKEPGLNITETALMVGYSSISSFGSAFLKYHGISPTQYRKKYVRQNAAGKR